MDCSYQKAPCVLLSSRSFLLNMGSVDQQQPPGSLVQMQNQATPQSHPQNLKFNKIPGDSYAHKKFYNRCYKQTLSTKCRNSAPRRLRAYPVNQSTTCFLTVCSAHDANGGSQSITQTLEHLCKRTSAEWQLGSSSLEGTGHTTKWQMREEIWATWDLSQKEPWESEVYYYSNDYSVQPLQTSPRCLSW